MKKRLFAFILAGSVVLGIYPQAAAETVKAVPVVSKVSINGRDTNLSAYNIQGYNYFKLRDVAALLTGTEKGFSVDYTKDSISLTSRSAYAAQGGELAETESTAAKDALAAAVSLTVDGKSAAPSVYNIDGYNYFRLRDLMSLFDISLDWDGSLVIIDTSLGYSEDGEKGLPLFDTGSFYLTPEFCGMYIADTYDTTLAKIIGVAVLGAEVALDKETPGEAECHELSGAELQEVKNALGNNVRTAVKIFHEFPQGQNAEIRLYVRVTGQDGFSEDHCYILQGEIAGYWDMLPEK